MTKPIELDTGRWQQRLALPGGFNCQIMVIIENFPGPYYHLKPGDCFLLDVKTPAPIDIYFGIGHRPSVAADPLGDEITYYTMVINKGSGLPVPEMSDSQTVTIPPGKSIAPMKQLPTNTSGDLMVVLQWNVGNKIDGLATNGSASFPFSFERSPGGFRGEVY